MSDYMKNQGLVDGITGCRNRQRELAKENKRLINVVVTYEAEIEELRSYLDEEREKNEKQVRMTMDAHAEIERLKGDIQILKLQRDATHVSRCPRCAALEVDDVYD